MKPEDYPFRFRCRRTGNCCARPAGVVRVGPRDAAAIAAHLGLSEPGFRSRYLAASGDRLLNGPDARCVFLRGGSEAGCSIYPVRPAQCRSWPFWDEQRQPDALARAMRFCPGIEPLASNPRPDGDSGSHRP